MAPNTRSYIAQSALAAFLLEVSQSYEPGIAGLAIEFVDEALTPHRCNWIVVSVDSGKANPCRAYRVVATVERVNSGWIMVEDGSSLDGQVVGQLLH